VVGGDGEDGGRRWRGRRPGDGEAGYLEMERTAADSGWRGVLASGLERTTAPATCRAGAGRGVSGRGEP
jgi:hypothetical protein